MPRKRTQNVVFGGGGGGHESGRVLAVAPGARGSLGDRGSCLLPGGMQTREGGLDFGALAVSYDVTGRYNAVKVTLARTPVREDRSTVFSSFLSWGLSALFSSSQPFLSFNLELPHITSDITETELGGRDGFIDQE